MRFRGNLTFTHEQEELFRKRYHNQGNSIPHILKGYANEIGNIKRGAKEFFLDAENGPGNDRGGWYPVAAMNVNGSGNNPFQPYGSAYGLPRRLFNIHYAALDALADNDRRKALQVLEEIIFQANNDYLDFGNGTTKTNSTLGTQNVFDRSSRLFINPVFMVAAKMVQYIVSYGHIHFLVKDTDEYAAGKERLDQWFTDAAEWMKAIIENTADYWFLSGDWRTFSGVGPRSAPLSGLHTHYDVNGENGVNEIGDLQVNTINNRIWNLVAYVGAYGYHYQEQDYKDLNFDYFKLSVIIGTYPDGTFLEHFRSDSYKGGAVGALRSGIDYTSESLNSMIVGAHMHEISVLKGLDPKDSQGKYYGFETSEGTDEFFTTFGYDSTSGGPKGIRTMIKNLSDYYREPADGGFKGERYNTEGVPFDPSEQTFSLLPAKANFYYRDIEIRDFAFFETEAGYPISKNNAKAFNYLAPCNHAIGIGVGAAEAGILAFLIVGTEIPKITANQTLSIGQDGRLYISNGNSIEIPASDPQVLSILGDQLTLSGGGGTVTIPSVASGDGYGPELLLQPSFDADDGSWTKIASATIANGIGLMEITASPQNNGIFHQAVTYEDGAEYRLVINELITNSGRIYVQDNSSNTGGLQAATTTITGNGTLTEHVYDFTANSNSNTARITRALTGATYNVEIHSCSLRKKL